MHPKKPIATSKMKPFVALISGFQPLTNVTKNPISGAVRVLDLPLEHTVQVFKLSKVAGLRLQLLKMISVFGYRISDIGSSSTQISFTTKQRRAFRTWSNI